MRWYRDLYIGDNARKKAGKIIEKVNKNKLQKNVFLITKAANGCDLFDIYPAHVFLQKHFKTADYLIIGLALGYDEALLLVQTIVDELYCKQGITNLKEYFEG